jgi:hypothetical protein
MTRDLFTVWAVVTALSGAACTVNQAPEATLSGPSDYATSLIVTATPDTIVLNGQQSVVIVEAHSVTGPLANLRIHLDELVGGLPSACGRLSASELTTGSDGRASAIFSAPTMPLPLPECAGLGGSLTFRAFPIGTNAQTTVAFTARLNLLTPTANTPATVFAVNFSMAPNPGSVGAEISFADAGSVSPGHSIANSGFQWTFSDGTVKIGPTIMHDFGAPGIYTVGLTITDDIGQQGSKNALITIN